MSGRPPTQGARIVRAGVRVLRDPRYAALALFGTVLFLVLYLGVPALFVPGETLPFELTHFTTLGGGALVLLALMSGALFTLEVYAFRISRAVAPSAVGESGAGLVASLLGGILAAASCGCGAGILLGAIGLGGGALFVVAHQTAIIVAMLAIVTVGLYYSARRAAGICPV